MQGWGLDNALSLLQPFPKRGETPENFFQSLENRRKIFPIVGKTGQNFPIIGKTAEVFQPLETFGSSGILVDGNDDGVLVGQYSENGACASIPPLREGGAARWKEYSWIETSEQMKRAAGGVLRPAVDACCCMMHPQKACYVCCQCGIALGATAPRSTPPVAAPAACLLPGMNIPSMAAPPPSRRGACPVVLLAPARPRSWFH